MRLPVLSLVSLALLVTSGCAEAPLPTGSPTRVAHLPGPVAAIAPGPYTPGQSYFGRNNYIEYIAGNTPVIYSAPHGGTLAPTEIPDRTDGSCGETVSTSADLNTADLAVRMQQAHFARYGTYPHVIINRLHRRKLDANRTLAGGACGDAEAQTAWQEWHDFMGVARNAVLAGGARGWYMDMHGHAHTKQRVELGYLTTGAQLRLADATLNATAAYEDTSSVATMSRSSSHSFSALLNGPNALGTLYANNAIPAVPSAQDRAPLSGDSYFSGGYNVTRYGCGVEATALGGTSSGNLCGLQVEANYTGVRDTDASRQRFAEVTAQVLEGYLSTHWGIQLAGTAPNVAPTAAFTSSCSGLTCTFTDASTDGDGTIAARSWTFGDGGTSTAQHPTRTYAAAGTYTVSLTVTDDDGATGTKSASVTVTAPAASITLTATKRSGGGTKAVDLAWSGATGASVDVFRNGAKLVTTANDGAYTDTVSKGTYRYKVCAAGTTTCSNEASVTF